MYQVSRAIYQEAGGGDIGDGGRDGQARAGAARVRGRRRAAGEGPALLRASPARNLFLDIRISSRCPPSRASSASSSGTSTACGVVLSAHAAWRIRRRRASDSVPRARGAGARRASGCRRRRRLLPVAPQHPAETEDVELVAGAAWSRQENSPAIASRAARWASPSSAWGSWDRARPSIWPSRPHLHRLQPDAQDRRRLGGETRRDVAATPREAAEQADIVISMVVDGDQVASLLLDEPDGAVHGARDGAPCSST